MASPPLPYVAITPCRIADTRGNGFTGQYGPPALAGGVPRDFTLTGQCGIAGTAQAVSLNITVTNTLGPGFISIYPQGAGAPLVSTLNYVAGQTVANAAVVPLGTGGAITVIAGVSGADLIIDTNGYYAGGVVTSLNSLMGDVALATGTDLMLSPAGQTLTISANSASANTPNTLVRRDSTGSFTAGTVTLSGDLVLPDPARIFQGPLSLLMSGSTSLFLGRDAGSMALIPFGNTAIGAVALQHSSADSNTAVGFAALQSTLGGGNNAGIGTFVLLSNTTGHDNTAVGFSALRLSESGIQNTAIGANALFRNSSGFNNTAIGWSALEFNTTGASNIAVGNSAGSAIGTGSNNIDLGSTGVISDSATIRIGDPAVHSATYLAGVAGAAVAGSPVVVGSDGHLGVAPSSKRFKEDIVDIGEVSADLFRLRPVRFKYKAGIDPMGLWQYGLIAEEVAGILPELVVNDEEGRPATVRYQLLVPMLLNELKRQHQQIEDQRRTIEDQARWLRNQMEQIQDLAAHLQKLEERIGQPSGF